ncbi:hypothetical protein B0H11DRAFT_2034192 [Mycena galericulata]|nr:hypothetical protein B0H11DRAFT_2034192 [Mycena galericulata]
MGIPLPVRVVVVPLLLRRSRSRSRSKSSERVPEQRGEPCVEGVGGVGRGGCGGGIEVDGCVRGVRGGVQVQVRGGVRGG